MKPKTSPHRRSPSTAACGIAPAAFVLALLCFALAPASTRAAGRDTEYVRLWTDAVDAYQAEDYQRALETWTRMADRPEWLSAALYYNLGNAWRMLGESGKAAWMYERALAINPRARDARDNLRLVRAQHPEPPSRPIFVSRFLAWVTSRLTAGEWAAVAFLFYAIAALSGAVWVLVHRGKRRLLAGTAAILCAVGAAMATAFFIPRCIDAEFRQYAVVIQPDAIVRNAPGREDEDSAYFEALAGERFQVRQASLTGWMRVKNPQDGRVGYLPEDVLGVI